MITLYPLPKVTLNAYSIVAAHENDFPAVRAYMNAMIQIRGKKAITLPCGWSCRYEKLPEYDVPCPCGNPEHYMVKYFIAPLRDKNIRN